MTTRARRLVVAVCAVALLVGVAAYGLSRSEPVPAPTAAPPPTTAAPTTTTTAPPPPPSPVPATTAIAEVTGPVAFFDAPDGALAGTLPVGGWWHETKHLPVIDTTPGWLQVRLPQRPNGLTGWISASDAALTTTTLGILIDVSDYRVQLFDAGELVADVPAGVGTQYAPTPLGEYYVMDVAEAPHPGWGPFILDTNAHSEAIQSWEGSGDAFTAIHGPLGGEALIGDTGGAVSHGCVRLHDADLALLAPVPPGAPVIIVA